MKTNDFIENVSVGCASHNRGIDENFCQFPILRALFGPDDRICGCVLDGFSEWSCSDCPLDYGRCGDVCRLDLKTDIICEL